MTEQPPIPDEQEQPFWVRVRVKETGDHISVHNVDPDVHVPLKQPGADRLGRPYRAKPNINLGRENSTATKEENDS